MSETTTTIDQPEFHIVVKRPNKRGPLAPYRFMITIVFALIMSGMPLWNALQTGHGLDPALLRWTGSAAFAWIVLGQINKILGSASVPTPPAAPESTSADS